MQIAVLYAPWRIERGSSAGPATRGPSCCGCWPATPRSRSCTSRPTPTPGAPVGDAVPGARARLRRLRFAPLDAADLAGLDLVFCVLPHGERQASAARPARPTSPTWSTSAPTSGSRPTSYARWYGEAHRAPEVLGGFAYGLVELYRDEIAPARARRRARLLPDGGQPRVRAAARARLRRAAGIVADAVSGVSGAGAGSRPRACSRRRTRTSPRTAC